MYVYRHDSFLEGDDQQCFTKHTETYKNALYVGKKKNTKVFLIHQKNISI